MLKLFGNIGFRITLEILLMLSVVWFYLVLSEPTIFNQVLFGFVSLSLLVSFCLDMNQILGRFINTPGK